MSFGTAVTRCLTSGYADFSGRARRSEYWWFVFFTALIGLVFSFVFASAGRPDPDTGQMTAIGLSAFAVYALIGLALLLPSLAVQIRRLHDTGRSGLWWFVGLVPVVGGLILLYFFVQDSMPSTNEYGPNPKTTHSGHFSRTLRQNGANR